MKSISQIQAENEAKVSGFPTIRHAIDWLCDHYKNNKDDICLALSNYLEGQLYYENTALEVELAERLATVELVDRRIPRDD